MDLDELRERLLPAETALLNALMAGPAGQGEAVAVGALAEQVGQPLDAVQRTLRLLADLSWVELRENESQVRLRAAGVLALRRPPSVLDRFAVVGQLWSQLSAGSRRLAKLATGLIGLAVLGQVVAGIHAIASAIAALAGWLGRQG